MAGVSLRNSPFSPFSASPGVSEILHSPYRGEEENGGSFRRSNREVEPPMWLSAGRPIVVGVLTVQSEALLGDFEVLSAKLSGMHEVVVRHWPSVKRHLPIQALTAKLRIVGRVEAASRFARRIHRLVPTKFGSRIPRLAPPCAAQEGRKQRRCGPTIAPLVGCDALKTQESA